MTVSDVTGEALDNIVVRTAANRMLFPAEAYLAKDK